MAAETAWRTMAKTSVEIFESAVESFEEAWHRGVPDIDTFLAICPGDDELVCELSLIDLEYRVKRGEPVSIDSYSHRLTAETSRVSFVQEARKLESRLRGSVNEQSLGSYVLLEKIGEGGMGTVYRARHRLMNRIVALKLLSPAFARDRDAVVRFEREAKTTARLEHPNIVPAYDFGEHEGTAFLVMPYVRGRDLGRLVREQGPVSVADALAYLRQAAVGLAYAHSQGVVHRDVKPGNLLLGDDSMIHILDLGLARTSLADADDEHLTLASQILGTVDFMAPEQAVTPSQADARVDVYSLGVSFWYLVTGQPLFSGETVFQRMLAHKQSPIPKLRTAVPEVSDAVDAVFRRLVAKEPRERFQSMEDVIAAIDGLSAGVPWYRRRAAHAAGFCVGAAIAGMLIQFAATSFSSTVPQQQTEGQEPTAGSTSTAGVPLSPAGALPSFRNSIGMELVTIPAGRFEMGSALRIHADEPLHEVVITRPFSIGTTEVTQKQWYDVMSTRPWVGRPMVKEADDCAAAYVSWDDAVEFCSRLTSLESLAAEGQRYALPTEAQWEYACRAGTSTMWCFGDDATKLSEFAWWGGVQGNGPAAGEPYPHEVGRKKANPWGLHDMHGNVNEWCRDWYDRASYEVAPREDPPGPPTGMKRVVRGGHWRLTEVQTRSSNRAQVRASDRHPDLGFRIVLERSPDAAAAPGGATDAGPLPR